MLINENFLGFARGFFKMSNAFQYEQGEGSGTGEKYSKGVIEAKILKH